MINFGTHHGTKRHPDEDLEGEQRLTKRLNRLHLDHYRHAPSQQPQSDSTEPRESAEDRMFVDDTKDRIYIRDLDAELAELEEEEKQDTKIQFLPQIEKNLAAFPSQFHDRAISPSEGQLVLYNPVSFSEEFRNDQRKFILEARRRAQEREALQQAGQEQESLETLDDIDPNKPSEPLDNPDVMDIG